MFNQYLIIFSASVGIDDNVDDIFWFDYIEGEQFWVELFAFDDEGEGVGVEAFLHAHAVHQLPHGHRTVHFLQLDHTARCQFHFQLSLHWDFVFILLLFWR